MEFDVGSEAATGIEVRKVVLEGGVGLDTFGVIGGGCETMRYAWPKLRHMFSVRNNGDTTPCDLEDPPTILFGPHRIWRNLLVENPVDLLVIERGHHSKASGIIRSETWEEMAGSTPTDKRPQIVLEAWRSDIQVWKYRPMCKPTVTRWLKLGYQSHCKFVNATAIGGAVDQDRALVIRVRSEEANANSGEWKWDQWDHNLSVIRPMSNLLVPPGLVHRTPKWHSHPMPPKVGALIETDKGTRGLMAEEVARGLGVPKGAEKDLSTSSLDRTTSVFHWEYLAYSLQQFYQRTTSSEAAGNHGMLGDLSILPEKPQNEESSDDFEWVPPDLSPGNKWHRIHVSNLWEASRTYPNSQEVFEDGMRRLAIHRDNYTSEGPEPKRLQLLWWEFPAEHWEELRLGARQNFLKPPEELIKPNAPMDEEMTIAAAEFVDELLELGVLRDIDEGNEVLTNAPLFVVPKEGQPGQ